MDTKPNKGIMFKNSNKKTEKSPDYKGSININGIDYKFSGWLNTAKSGVKYISLSLNIFTEKQEHKEGVQPIQQTQYSSTDYNDDDVF